MSSHDQTVESLHTLMKAMMAGVPKLPAGVTAVTVLGTTYTMPELLAKLATLEAPYAAAEAADLQAQQAAEKRDENAAETREFVTATKGAFKTALGRKSAVLETLGITPDKTPAPPTVEETQARVAKAKATRAARHTMGKKQKSKIKGQVPPAQSP